MEHQNHTLGETHRLWHLRASLGFALEPSPVIVQFVILVQMYSGFPIQRIQKKDCFPTVQYISSTNPFSVH